MRRTTPRSQCQHEVDGKPLCGTHARIARRDAEAARVEAELEASEARRIFGDREVPDGWRKAWRDYLYPAGDDPDEQMRIALEAIFKLREYKKNAKS
jgi:hypothetical protein